jgi:hypothetical protein
MEQKGLRTGHIVALVGALVAFASLWRPWYSIDVPDQLRDALGGSGAIGGDPGLLGQFARGLASALPQKIEASAWTELAGADVVLAAAALAVVGLVAAAAGAFGAGIRVDPASAARGIGTIGFAGVVLVVLHVFHRPGPHAIVTVADGLWIALAGCAAITAGGVLATTQSGGRARATRPATTPAFPPLDPELPAVFAPSPTAATGSVAPPGA